jgi:hypothetical protein
VGKHLVASGSRRGHGHLPQQNGQPGWVTIATDFGKRFGSCADELVLIAAVLIGQAEGKPMNASKLATYAGIPRTTVIRKLQALARRGVLERIDSGLYALPDRVVNSAPVLRAADASRKRIRRAAAALGG